MTSDALILITGMAVVTFIPRFFPLLLLSKKEISPSFSRWMSFIPVSIFAALVASDVFFWEGSFSLQPIQNIKLIPSVLVLFVAYKTKSLLWSMITGVLAMALLYIFL
ncbi:Branched-chain amino acid transport protein [Alkalibacterium putridalgicola]|uniref:Branched-chain amino acid transport protein n=1 Tax=Alkalibacterium putridalgicola TaxID=426703 RepID=A0A1H7WQI9_9LACT|nr:AzlD domain-containing protein [Alkalibacterium putridalgicola]GEK89636.1 branched-chain amino acid transporter [Alkalibacterium putridalgicola]SEM23762.1 Branched-chain amino acid transport protein [Alkalibacterium putridalgicola]